MGQLIGKERVLQYSTSCCGTLYGCSSSVSAILRRSDLKSGDRCVYLSLGKIWQYLWGKKKKNHEKNA